MMLKVPSKRNFIVCKQTVYLCFSQLCPTCLGVQNSPLPSNKRKQMKFPTENSQLPNRPVSSIQLTQPNGATSELVAEC